MEVENWEVQLPPVEARVRTLSGVSWKMGVSLQGGRGHERARTCV